MENNISDQNESQISDSQGKSKITSGIDTQTKSISPPYYAAYMPWNKKPQYLEFKNRVISSKGLMISILSIILCVLFTETIFLGSAGISAPIYLAAFYSTIFYYFRENNTKLNKAAVILTIPSMFMAGSFFLHFNPSTRWITWITLIGIISIQLVLLGNININGIFSLDMLVKVIVNLIGKPFVNLAMPFHSLGVLKNNKSSAVKNTVYSLIGLAVAVPVAAILMSLFISADAVFADSVHNVIDFLGIDFSRLSVDIFIGVLTGIFMGAALLGLKYEKAKEISIRPIGDKIESTIVGTFLTVINIFIIAFVGFQFIYLFGGAVNIRTSDMSYAEYARRGFFELSAASALIFAIALFVLIMTKRNNGKLPMWICLSTVIMCAGDGVLLVSAVKRMLLYVNVYGLSIKRVLTLWLMVLVGLCLMWMIIKCFVMKIDVMKWIGITVIAGVCVLSLTNIEKVIAEYNVDSYLSNPKETSIVLYFNELSYTAVPELISLRNAAGDDLKDINIKEILENKYHQLEARHIIYGFTLDSIEAAKIFKNELK
jgi:hypothetical protein